MGHAAGRADRFKFEAPLEFLEPVPQAFTSGEKDGHDVRVVDQVGRQELADCRWSSANPDVSRSPAAGDRGPEGWTRIRRAIESWKLLELDAQSVEDALG